jgi:putative ABC transport system permease protein
MDYRRTGIAEERLPAAYVDLLERMRRQPGVDDAAQVRNVPVGGSFSNRTIVVDGVTRKENVNYNVISDRYFTTLGTALLAGRDFDRRDTKSSAPVAIVTESFARVFFGGGNPIGQTFQIEEPPGRPKPSYQIVGLARDSKFEHLRDPFEPLMYVPMAQDAQLGGAGRIVVRSRMPMTSVSSTVTAVAREVHPAIVASFRTMETQLKDSVLRERLMATLSGLFGGLAALIAMVGVYGVMSYAVARRRHEIGIRMALGADRRQVIGMVMRNAGRLLAIGLGTGALFALVAGRAAEAFLFGVAPHDPLTLAAAALGLALTAAIASGVPALRASSLSPTEALRED